MDIGRPFPTKKLELILSPVSHLNTYGGWLEEQYCLRGFYGLVFTVYLVLRYEEARVVDVWCSGKRAPHQKPTCSQP